MNRNKGMVWLPYVNTYYKVYEQRDSKGLYAKTRAREIKNFTGIDSLFEPPERADITLEEENKSPQILVDELRNFAFV